MRFSIILFFAVAAHAQNYFPSGAFRTQPDADRRAASSYSSVLEALGEQSLFSLSPVKGVECYRFTWLRAFSRPVVLRLNVLAGGEGKLVIKVGEFADGPNGANKPATLVRDETKILDQRTTGRFRSYIDLSDLYALPVDDNIGMDGSRWLIEAVSYGKYHIVSRWSPKDGAVRETGTRLIYLAIGGDFVPIY